MLEARVNTVDAIEWTVCVESRLVARGGSSFSLMVFSWTSSMYDSWIMDWRLVLMKNLHTR